MIRIVREPTKRELWLGDRRLFLSIISDNGDFGECDEETAEREMLKCLAEWAEFLAKGGKIDRGW